MQRKEDFRKCIFQFLSWIPHQSLGHLTCAEESPGMKTVLWFSSFVLILICANLFRITRICLDLQEFDYICKNLLRFAGICLDLQWFLWFVILCLDLQEFVWICKKLVAFITRRVSVQESLVNLVVRNIPKSLHQLHQHNMGLHTLICKSLHQLDQQCTTTSSACCLSASWPKLPAFKTKKRKRAKLSKKNIEKLGNPAKNTKWIFSAKGGGTLQCC